MNNVKKTKIDTNRIGTNPLTVTEFVIRVNKIPIKGTFISDNDVLLPNVSTIEYDTSTKVYNNSEHRLFVSGLSPASKSLFLWLIYEIDANIDYIWINKNRYLIENTIKSINTYKTAINELVRYCVIYPMADKKDVYWINPRLLFNGNRIKKYPKHLELINDSSN